MATVKVCPTANTVLWLASRSSPCGGCDSSRRAASSARRKNTNMTTPLANTSTYLRTAKRPYLNKGAVRRRCQWFGASVTTPSCKQHGPAIHVWRASEVGMCASGLVSNEEHDTTDLRGTEREGVTLQICLVTGTTQCSNL